MRDPELEDLLAGSVDDPLDVDGFGIESEIGEWLDFFERSAWARMIMTCARRAGCSFQEAAHRWEAVTNVAAEFAWDMRHAARLLRECPQCGIDPNDVLSEDRRRMLENGKVKIEVRGCVVCGGVAQAQRDITKEERERGDHVRVVPRNPGDPFLDL